MFMNRLLTVFLFGAIAPIGVSQAQVISDFATEQQVVHELPNDLDQFGSAVAISNDYALVGVMGDDFNGGFSGSVYSFVRQPAGTWTPNQLLVASDGASDDKFGFALDMSGDLAIIGAYGKDGFWATEGAAYIFERRFDGTWHEMQKLVLDDAVANDRFGFTVAISGETAFVGAPYRNGDFSDTGSVYIYDLQTDDTWSLVAELLPPKQGQFNDFGKHVDAHGNTLLVTEADDQGGESSGTVHVYERNSDGLWVYITALKAPVPQAFAGFGFNASIFEDTIFAGCPSEDNANGENAGSTYIFERQDDNSWLNTATLLTSDGAAADYFGYGIDHTNEIAVIGASASDELAGGSGSAYLYERQTDGSWSEVHKLIPSEGSPGASYGVSIAISDRSIVIGAPAHDAVLSNDGCAFFHDWNNVMNLDTGDGFMDIEEAIAIAWDRDELAVRNAAFDIDSIVLTENKLDFIAVEPVDIGSELMLLPGDGSTFVASRDVAAAGFTLSGRFIAPEGGEILFDEFELTNSAQFLQNNCRLFANGPFTTSDGVAYLTGDLLATKVFTDTAGANRVAGDTRVFSDYTNAGATIIQEGILYIYGDLENTGTLTGEFNNGLAGGGTPEPGDGFSIGGNYSIGVDATLSLPNPVWWLRVGGDLDIAIDTPQHFAMSEATIELNGLAPGLEQTLETLSADFGATESGFDPSNFPIGTLRIANGSNTRLVNTHQNTTNTPCEVLYTETLVIEAGASLTTAGCQIYTKELILAGTVDDSSNIVIVTACVGDINGDDIVNGVDLSLLLGAWNSDTAYADLNNDGTVNGTDLTILLGAWGPCSR